IEKETQVSYLNDMSYAFVELSKFGKTLEELVTAEDYWIYMMKHAPQMREAPRNAPDEVKQAYALLERHNWTREERLAYKKAKIGLMDDLDIIQTAREEGIEEGEYKKLPLG
ncbi:MAG: PD-(D/E)XK nuclease family transposase, partial [Janthinobacterium lividum]